jgi:amidophosphoribosyltransferase
VAGIIAICYIGEDYEKEKLIYNIFRGMQLLQHRGKAFWKINSGKFDIEGYGALPSFNPIGEKIQQQKKNI